MSYRTISQNVDGAVFIEHCPIATTSDKRLTSNVQTYYDLVVKY